jgi:hypothetical protein
VWLRLLALLIAATTPLFAADFSARFEILKNRATPAL